MEDKAQVSDYHGVHFTKIENNSFKFTQHHLIEQIIDNVGLSKSKFKPPPTPSPSTKILHRNEQEEDFDQSPFNYQSVVGKINYLEKTTRPDIAYAAHQCARHSHAPKRSHGEAVIFLVKYPAGTKDCGIILSPDQTKSLKAYADADFCGNWLKMTAMDDVSTAKSRTGYAINFCGCPVGWSSKLQTQIALSTTEAEYMALSTALREVIPLLQLIKEMQRLGFEIFTSVPLIYCKAFEDNSGAMEMSCNHKLQPRTKHINVIYHHFQ